MALAFWVDIESRTGDRTTYGPLHQIQSWSQVSRVDRAGEFSVTMPLTPRAAAIAEKTILHCYAMIDGYDSPVNVGSGIVDDIKIDVDRSGETITFRGPDLFRELARVLTQALIANSFDSPAYLIYAANSSLNGSGWSIEGQTQVKTLISIEYRYDTVLRALVSLAQNTGEHFTAGSVPRSVKWLGTVNDFEDAGLIATTNAQAMTTADEHVALITRISKISQTWDLVNRVYLFGSGSGNERLTLAQSSFSSLPYGYQFNKSKSTIENHVSIDKYGIHEAVKTFGDIRPTEDTSDAVVAASDTLMLAGFNYLRTQLEPIETYQIEVALQGFDIKPGQKLRVDARRYYDGQTVLDIDKTLYVLERTLTIDAHGVRTASLVASTSDTWPQTDQGYILERINEVVRAANYPQLNSSTDTTSYLLTVSEHNDVAVGFWMDKATLVQSVTLRFNAESIFIESDELVITVNNVGVSGPINVVDLWYEVDITEPVVSRSIVSRPVADLNFVQIQGLNEVDAIVNLQIETRVIKQ